MLIQIEIEAYITPDFSMPFPGRWVSMEWAQNQLGQGRWVSEPVRTDGTIKQLIEILKEGCSLISVEVKFLDQPPYLSMLIQIDSAGRVSKVVKTKFLDQPPLATYPSLRYSVIAKELNHMRNEDETQRSAKKIDGPSQVGGVPAVAVGMV